MSELRSNNMRAPKTKLRACLSQDSSRSRQCVHVNPHTIQHSGPGNSYSGFEESTNLQRTPFYLSGLLASGSAPATCLPLVSAVDSVMCSKEPDHDNRSCPCSARRNA